MLSKFNKIVLLLFIGFGLFCSYSFGDGGLPENLPEEELTMSISGTTYLKYGTTATFSPVYSPSTPSGRGVDWSCPHYSTGESVTGTFTMPVIGSGIFTGTLSAELIDYDDTVLCSNSVGLRFVIVDLDVDSNYDGSITGDDDSLEETAGGIVPLNNLVEIKIADLREGALGTVTLSAISGGSKIRVWENPDRTGLITLGTPAATWDVATATTPFSLYVEGISASSAARDIELRLRNTYGSVNIDDNIKLTVYGSTFSGPSFVKIGDEDVEYELSFSPSNIFQSCIWDLGTSGFALNDPSDVGQTSITATAPSEFDGESPEGPVFINYTIVTSDETTLTCSFPVHLVDCAEQSKIYGMLREVDPSEPNTIMEGSGYFVGENFSFSVELFPHDIYDYAEDIDFVIMLDNLEDISGDVYYNTDNGVLTINNVDFSTYMGELAEDCMNFHLFAKFDGCEVFLLSSTVDAEYYNRQFTHNIVGDMITGIRKNYITSTREPIDVSTGNNYFTERRLYVRAFLSATQLPFIHGHIEKLLDNSPSSCDFMMDENYYQNENNCLCQKPKNI